MTEVEMREAKVPTPQTDDELIAYVRGLVEQPQDYGTCVYAMSMAATATFNYVASKLVVTGFQASCADMDILRRTRSWKGPAMVIDLTNHLYPQYDLVGRVREAIAENSEWFATAAKEKLAENSDDYPAHPDVVRHWKKLVKAA